MKDLYCWQELKLVLLETSNIIFYYNKISCNGNNDYEISCIENNEIIDEFSHKMVMKQ